MEILQCLKNKLQVNLLLPVADINFNLFSFHFADSHTSSVVPLLTGITADVETEESHSNIFFYLGGTR